MPTEVDFEYALFKELNNIRKYIKRRFDSLQLQVEKLSEDVIQVHQLIGYGRGSSNSYHHQETLPVGETRHCEPELLSSTHIPYFHNNGEAQNAGSKNKRYKHKREDWDESDSVIHNSDIEEITGSHKKASNESRRRKYKDDEVVSSKRQKLRKEPHDRGDYETESVQILSDETYQSSSSKFFTNPKSKKLTKDKSMLKETATSTKPIRNESSTSSNKKTGENPFAYPAWKPPKNRKNKMTGKSREVGQKSCIV